MTKELTGKVALVTGGSRGIGKAVAIALATNGADVAIGYAKQKDAADAVVAQLEALGVRAAAFPADQGEPTEAADLVDRVAAQFGKLDILVNNAGVFAWGPVASEYDDAEAFARQHTINYTSIVAAIRAAIPHLTDGGRIISIGSGASIRVGALGMADYTATKSALVGFSKGAARDLAERGITINVLQAGYVDTDMNPESGPNGVEWGAATALGRYGRPEEIAAGAAFLASPSASYVTGSVLTIDGGYNA